MSLSVARRLLVRSVPGRCHARPAADPLLRRRPARAPEHVPALALWLLPRLADGLDGPLARRRRAGSRREDAGAGGFFDITADFAVYGAGVVGVAVGTAGAGSGPWEPFLLVLLAYYVNGAAFLAFSSIAERSGRQLDDGRSLSFIGGLAEGT